MGFSLSWVAVKTENQDAVLETLALTATTETDEYFESALAGVALRDDWYLVVVQEANNLIIAKESLADLSRIGMVIACSVEEHVMVSSAECWFAGEKRWQVTHNAQESLMNLTAEGQLPARFETLKAQYLADQEEDGGESADVDHVFEVPLALASTLVGFKHDEDCSDVFANGLPMMLSGSDESEATFTFEIKKPWWRFW
ncbi:hypothetical protein K6Q96_12400 [Grimontia kaedaensis]|uniref:Uncharacterized protein n=1 Tax=Grimontia kaedaensis TaxID=2872157 RepID=A0ABY4WT06_9GAMM|nr:hypothetical protein [Grimontia kaedaensis]USH01678.1 hypothetical protein K6Q96_12400 [Grimontia kaedaensis]